MLDIALCAQYIRIKWIKAQASEMRQSSQNRTGERAMTSKQIKKALEVGGMDMAAVSEINNGEFEVFVDNGEGKANISKTKKAINKARKILPWGGFYAGYGGFIFQEGFKSKGDYMDRASAWHY